MKRTQRPSSSPAVPTVRALPPQKRRLTDIPGVVPAFRFAGIAAVGLLVLYGAAGAVAALDSGALPRVAIPLASLGVLAATAAYLAGRAEGKNEISSTAQRGRTKSRLRTASPAADKWSFTSDAASSDGDPAQVATPSAALASQAGSAVLRTKFLDDISQALRAPITSICLAARIIRKHFDSTPEVVAHFGDTLLAEADRLGQAVDEFLELARLESGLVEWHETEVDAADLIQRAVAEVESVAVSYGVSVAFTMEPALPTLHVDRERVAQALTILLAMAVRSASEGSEIVIQIAGAHGGWVFTVGGTSFVYPHAEARKVHVREDGAVANEQPGPRPDGVGLGLCLCREIIAQYQGRLWIEGTPGPSGCVRFTIPYRQHRRQAVTTATEKPQTVSRPETAAASSESCPVDLEQRRELAVKALRERAAAAQPRVDAAPTVQTASADATAAPAATAHTEANQPVADADAESSRAAESQTTTPVAEQTTPPVAAEPSAGAHVGERPVHSRTGQKISFGHRHTVAEQDTPPRFSPVSSAKREEPVPTAFSAVEPEPLVPQHDEPAAEVEIVDAPVHAPVSGTMITAHHRTAGPAMLSSPGVPALSGMQSAANAAMHGSDDLLLEIAEAQSPDGRSLIVSEEVRSLLASAPGTLPAVAGQNTLTVAARTAYTPSRRRMVQSPWVVRSTTDEQSAPAEASADVPHPSAAEPAAGGQRARLNERLAKRLGLTGNSQAGRSESPSGGTSGGAYLRSRRLGSR